MTGRTPPPVSSHVRFEAGGRIGVLTLDRPAARNAINGDMAMAIEACIDALEADDDLWVGIITAEPPAFCAGADLKDTRAGAGRSVFTKRGGFAGITARVRTKPIIAAVNGPALAGGTEIVLACDLVVAAPAATFGLPETRRSLIASAGGLFRLGRKIPENIAMECAITGDPISAVRAHQFGLVNVLDESPLDAALALADRICDNAPLAVRASRRVLLEATRADDESAWRLSRAELRGVMSSDDHVEGLASFVEKRAPRWRGR